MGHPWPKDLNSFGNMTTVLKSRYSDPRFPVKAPYNGPFCKEKHCSGVEGDRRDLRKLILVGINIYC